MSTSFFDSSSLILLSFSATLAPASSNGWTRTAAEGKAGLSAQISSTKFFVKARSSTPAASSFVCNSLAHVAGCTLGSIPTAAPLCKLQASQSLSEGVEGSPVFINSQLLLSSSAACWKYRPSVHSKASESVMTAEPAEPVKPVRNFLLAKQSGGISDKWGSSVGTM